MQSIDSIFSQTLMNLLSHGKRSSTRGGGARELIGFSAKISPDYAWLHNERRKLDKAYAAAETLWYVSRTNDTTYLQKYAPQYENFTEDGRIAHGAYGHRFKSNVKGVDQFRTVIDILKRKPESRQAIVSLWNPRDLLHARDGDRKDLPCTIALQYCVSGGLLHAVTFMRSNDIWLGFPYDVFAFTCLQRIVAAELGLAVGTYTHNVGNMHLYDRNAAAAEEAVNGHVKVNAIKWETPTYEKEMVQAFIQSDAEEPCNFRGDMAHDLLHRTLHFDIPRSW